MGPSATAFYGSAFERRGELASYSFDGHRYVLAAADELSLGRRSNLRAGFIQVFEHLPVHHLRGSDEGAERVVGEAWRANAQEQGLEVVVVLPDGLESLAVRAAHQPIVVVMVKAGNAYPSQLLDADSIFVTAFEPDVGTVLYRRRAFDELWSGIALLFDGPPTGGP